MSKKSDGKNNVNTDGKEKNKSIGYGREYTERYIKEVENKIREWKLNDHKKHDWRDRKTAEETIKYIEKHKGEDVTAKHLWEKIAGLNGEQIQAYALGVERETIEKCPSKQWLSNSYTAHWTLKYIQKRPPYVSADDALKRIKGLKGEEIKTLSRQGKQGYTEKFLAEIHTKQPEGRVQ